MRVVQDRNVAIAGRCLTQFFVPVGSLLYRAFAHKPAWLTPKWFSSSRAFCCGVWLLFAGGAWAAHKLAWGAVTPFTGNPSDVVTVRLSILGGLNVRGSIFDNGSLVIVNIPRKGKPRPRCDATAIDCVVAPGDWFLKGPGIKQIRQGAEIGSGSIFFPQTVQWRRLPGSLIVRFYVVGNWLTGVPSGGVESKEVDARAGQTYFFTLAPEQVRGGTTIRIE